MDGLLPSARRARPPPDGACSHIPRLHSVRVTINTNTINEDNETQLKDLALDRETDGPYVAPSRFTNDLRFRRWAATATGPPAARPRTSESSREPTSPDTRPARVVLRSSGPRLNVEQQYHVRFTLDWTIRDDGSVENVEIPNEANESSNPPHAP